MNLSTQQEVDIYHSTYFNPETAKRYLNKISRTMYNECKNSQSHLCGIVRFDGTTSQFINNKNICYDEHLTTDHYILNLSGDITNYFMKKQFLRNYKNKVFTFEEVNEMNKIFERRIWLFINGYFVPKGYIIVKNSMVYICLKASDFDKTELNNIVKSNVDFSLIFLPHSNMLRGKDRKSTELYGNDTLINSQLDTKTVKVANSPYWTVFDKSNSGKRNMLLGTDMISYQNGNEIIYRTDDGFSELQKLSIYSDLYAYNDVNLLSTVTSITKTGLLQNKVLQKDFYQSESEQVRFTDEFISLTAKRNVVELLSKPLDTLQPNSKYLMQVQIFKNHLNGSGEIRLVNSETTVFNNSIFINPSEIIGTKLFYLETKEDINHPVLDLRISDLLIDGSIELKIELIPFENERSFVLNDGVRNFCVPLENAPINEKNILVYAYDNSTGTKKFIHNATVKGNYPNIYTIENVPNDILTLNVEYYGNENEYYDMFVSHKWYIDHIGEEAYLESFLQDTLLDPIKNYTPKVFDYSFENFLQNATDSSDTEEFDLYTLNKLIEFVSENNVLYKEMLEELHRTEYRRIAKNIYVDLEDPTWNYIYNRATTTTSMYDTKSGTVKDPDLMKYTSVHLNEECIYIKISDTDNTINDFAIWIDTLRIINFHTYIENFTTWIFIPKRLVTDKSIIEIEMIMKPNRKECMVKFDSIDTLIPLCSTEAGGYQEPYPALQTIGTSSDIVENDKILRYIVPKDMKYSSAWTLIPEGENDETLLFYNNELLTQNNQENNIEDIRSSVFTTSNIISVTSDNTLTEGIYGDKPSFWEDKPEMMEILKAYNVGKTNYGIFLRINKSRLLSPDIAGLLNFFENTIYDTLIWYGCKYPDKETRYTVNCMCDNFIPNNLLFFNKMTKEIYPQDSFFIKFNKNHIPLNMLIHRVNGLECSLGLNDESLVGENITIVTIDNYARIQSNSMNGQGTSRFEITNFEGFNDPDTISRVRMCIDGRTLYNDMDNISIERDKGKYGSAFTVTGAINSTKPEVEALIEYLPYGLKLVHSENLIATNGVIDLSGSINKPFSLLFFDVYLNGRKLTYKHIDVMCDDMVRIKNVNSLKHLRIYEKQPIGDMYTLFPTTNDHTDGLSSINSDLLRINDLYKEIYPDQEIEDTDDAPFDDIDIHIKGLIEVIEEIIFKLPIFPDENQLQDVLLDYAEPYLEPDTNVFMVDPDRFFNEITEEPIIYKVYRYNPDNDVVTTTE